MHPTGCRSHHVWADFLSKSALPRCLILDRHLVAWLFSHILYLYDMHSWRRLLGPSFLLCGFVEIYHHCRLQWRWHHLLMMCPLMVVTVCHWHLESWPWYDEILVVQWVTLTAWLLLHVVPCSGQLAAVCHLDLAWCLQWHRCLPSDCPHSYHFHSSGIDSLLLNCLHHQCAWWCSWSRSVRYRISYY